MNDRSTFAVIAATFRAGDATLDDLLSVLRVTPVYARRPHRPGLFFVDLGERGRWTYVFTTLDALARHESAPEAGGGIDYFSTTGADLLDNLLPPDVGLFIDAEDEHCLALPSSWLNEVQSNVDNSGGSWPVNGQ